MEDLKGRVHQDCLREKKEKNIYFSFSGVWSDNSHNGVIIFSSLRREECLFISVHFEVDQSARHIPQCSK